MEAEFLIVGGGVAGATAVETLRKAGVAGARITLLGAEPEVPYHRPPLSKAYLLEKEPREQLFVKPRAFYEEAGVRLLLGTRATAVDPRAHTVATDQGTTIQYRKLLLATGCTPRRLTVPGSDLEGIHTLRTLADADALRAAATAGKATVVIGGSFIGMELASSFTQRGCRTTLLHRGTAVFDRLGSPEVSAFFAAYFRQQGVDIRFEEEATAFTRQPDGRIAVTTRRGDHLAADLVVVGIGVTPATEFLHGSGIRTEDGIVVNEFLEASVPDVFAAGDVANFSDRFAGRQRRIEHWAEAIEHGKVAGANMAGQHGVVDVVPMFFSDVFDVSFEYFGDGEGTDTTIRRGTFAEKYVTLFFLRGPVVRAAFTMGRPRERKALLSLLRSGKPLTDPDLLGDVRRALSSSSAGS